MGKASALTDAELASCATHPQEVQHARHLFDSFHLYEKLSLDTEEEEGGSAPLLTTTHHHWPWTLEPGQPSKIVIQEHNILITESKRVR